MRKSLGEYSRFDGNLDYDLALVFFHFFWTVFVIHNLNVAYDGTIMGDIFVSTGFKIMMKNIHSILSAHPTAPFEDFQVRSLLSSSFGSGLGMINKRFRVVRVHLLILFVFLA